MDIIQYTSRIARNSKRLRSFADPLVWKLGSGNPVFLATACDKGVNSPI